MLKTNTKLSTPPLRERFCLPSPPTLLPGTKVKMKGGHLEEPFLGAGLGELLKEGSGDAPQEKEPCARMVTSAMTLQY